MIKVTGFDALQKTLKEASQAFKQLDGSIAEVSFDPNDRHSVDRAIRSMESAVDRKVGRFAKNPGSGSAHRTDESEISR